MSEEKKIVIVGMWKVLRPDTRQYKQQSVEIEFNNVPIFVEVPEEMFLNANVNGSTVNGLTPAGMKYVQDQLEKVYAVEDTPEDGWKEDAPVAEKDVKEVEEGWHLPPADGPVAETASEDDGWDSEVVFEESPVSNKPDTETDESWDEEGEWKNEAS